jgi:hypothetical protein
MPGGVAATVFLSSGQNPRLPIQSGQSSSEQHWSYLQPLHLPRSSLGSGPLPEHHQSKPRHRVMIVLRRICNLSLIPHSCWLRHTPRLVPHLG